MSGFFDSAFKSLGYLLSLPERSVRSLAAVAGGTTSLLTDTLFPETLRGTTLYRIFVGDAQQFIIQKVAQVQQAQAGETSDEAGGNDYVQRKMIGGALETAGLFAMHFSPLWVFAIAGDAAAGGNVFLDRLTNRLKGNGVIPLDTKITGLTDLLAAIEDTSRRSATAVDTPPLSREELSKLADDMMAGYGQVFSSATNLLPRMESLWQQMEKVADRQNVSIERLSGILTMDVAAWGRKGIGAVLAVGQTSTELFGEKILDSYARTLDTVAEEGVGSYLANRMGPFLQAATGHFSPGRKTWTESLLGLGDKEAEVEVAATTEVAVPAEAEGSIEPAAPVQPAASTEPVAPADDARPADPQVPPVG